MVQQNRKRSWWCARLLIITYYSSCTRSTGIYQVDVLPGTRYNRSFIGAWTLVSTLYMCVCTVWAIPNKQSQINKKNTKKHGNKWKIQKRGSKIQWVQKNKNSSYISPSTQLTSFPQPITAHLLSCLTLDTLATASAPRPLPTFYKTALHHAGQQSGRGEFLFLQQAACLYPQSLRCRLCLGSCLTSVYLYLWRYIVAQQQSDRTQLNTPDTVTTLATRPDARWWPHQPCVCSHTAHRVCGRDSRRVSLYLMVRWNNI